MDKLINDLIETRIVPGFLLLVYWFPFKYFPTREVLSKLIYPTTQIDQILFDNRPRLSLVFILKGNPC